MSKVKSKNTKLEINFKKTIKGLRLRYHPNVYGKPDFASKKFRIAVFIDSCFWHKCPKHFRKPTTNNFYWTQKINRNVERAKGVNRHLRKQGWKVLRFWEHEVKKSPQKCLSKIKKSFAK